MNGSLQSWATRRWHWLIASAFLGGAACSEVHTPLVAETIREPVHTGARRGYAPVIAADDDRLVAVWPEWSGPDLRLFVKQWNADARQWVLLGDAAVDGSLNVDGARLAMAPHAAASAAGVFVVWSESGILRVKRWADGAWHVLGKPLNVDIGRAAENPWLVVGSPGEISSSCGAHTPVHVAWEETGRVHVKRWDGCKWMTVGAAPGARGRETELPVLARQGRALYLAYVEWSGHASRIVVKRWQEDQGSWVELAGERLPLAGNAHAPALAADQGDLYLGWRETDAAGARNVVARYDEDDATWTNLGAVATRPRAGAIGPLALVFAAGSLHVGWTEAGDAGARLEVRRWDSAGGRWIADSGPLALTPEGVAQFRSLAVAAGVPHAAWEASGQVLVERREGTRWARVGRDALNAVDRNTGTGCRSITLPGFAEAGVVAYLAWMESQCAPFRVFVKRWDGRRWHGLGGALNLRPSSAAGHPDVAVIGAAPIVAWQESDTAGEARVHVKHWDGERWVAAGGSLNIRPEARATEPTIAVVGETPFVAWREEGDGLGAIFVRRWDGHAWIREGDAMNVAVDADARSPSLATIGRSLVLAWSEAGDGGHRIQVKRRVGGVWTALAPAGRNAHNPTVAVGGSSLYLSWQEKTSAQTRVRTARWLETEQRWRPVVDVVVSAAAGAPVLAFSTAGSAPWVPTTPPRGVLAWRESHELALAVGSGDVWDALEPIVRRRGAGSIAATMRGQLPALAWREGTVEWIRGGQSGVMRLFAEVLPICASTPGPCRVLHRDHRGEVDAVVEYEYDCLGRVTAREERRLDGSLLERLRYRYDGDLLMAVEEESVPGSIGHQVPRYEYEYQRGVLVRRRTADEVRHFAYDDFGRLKLERVGDRVTTSYQYEDGFLAHRLSGGSDSCHYQYDEVGRLLVESCDAGDLIEYRYSDDVLREKRRRDPGGEARETWSYDYLCIR